MADTFPRRSFFIPFRLILAEMSWQGEDDSDEIILRTRQAESGRPRLGSISSLYTGYTVLTKLVTSLVMVKLAAQRKAE